MKRSVMPLATGCLVATGGMASASWLVWPEAASALGGLDLLCPLAGLGPIPLLLGVFAKATVSSGNWLPLAIASGGLLLGSAIVFLAVRSEGPKPPGSFPS